MRLAQSENGSDLGNCCETVTQFISQSRSCFGTMRGHETGAGNLAGGRCFVSNDALDGNRARSAGRVVDTIGRSAIPAPSMGRRSVCFLSETGGVYEWKKNLMLAAIQLIKVSAVVFAISALSIGVGFLRASSHAEAHAPSSQPNADPNWSELIASMDKMHMAMEAVEYSGNSDVDFVRLMLPHHQAAVDMAKTQLLHGKDPQMRRLAQEIITDQQLEIEVMQLWLKQHEPAQPKENQTTAPNTPKDN